MESLRWILLAAGAVLIGAIYVTGCRRSPDTGRPAASTPNQPDEAFPPPWPSEHSAVDDAPATGAEPVPATDGLPTDLDRPDERVPAGDVSAPPGPAAAAPAEPTATAPGPAPLAAEPEQVIVLHLMSHEGERLVGARLSAAFSRHGLVHGELGAFHARSRDGHATDFSVANMVEPGSFEPATMDTLSTPGVVLFLRLPGPPAPAAAFERMVATARTLAEELDARLLDERRQPLTPQAEQHLRDELQQARAAVARDRGRERSRR